MLPTVNKIIDRPIEIVELPSRTYRLDIENNIISGFIDEQEAMKQAIYLMLETERFDWIIFSWNYGAELDDLYGQQSNWVSAIIQKRITDALLQDTRITAVEDFNIKTNRNSLLATFTARTIFGSLAIEKGVGI